MSFFKRFPLARYNYDGDSYFGIDITQSTLITKTNEKNHLETNIIDGETPEMIADKMYDNPNMSWIILYYNDIVNFYDSWPLTQYSLNEYVIRNYDDPEGIHHYASKATGLMVDELHPEWDRIIVTNYEYEYWINESKRKILIPVPPVAFEIQRRHQELMGRR